MDTVEYIYVDSRTRDTTLFPNGNAYSVYLTNPMKNISRVELVSAKLPNSIFNLTLGSNVLNVTTNVITGSISNISLQPSFFTSNTLATEITNTGRLPTGMTITYSPNEGKYLFANTNPFYLNVNTSEMATLLGLPQGVTLTSTLITSSDLVYGSNTNLVNKYLVKSSNVADFTKNDIIFLDIEEFRNQFLNLGSKASGNTFVNSVASHAFGPVTLDVDPGTLKTFKENSDYSLAVDFPQVVSKLSRLTVNWRDINGNLIPFNGSENNSFILRVHRTFVPPNLDRQLGLPPPVEWIEGRFMNPVYIIGFALVIGLLIILFTKKKLTSK